MKKLSAFLMVLAVMLAAGIYAQAADFSVTETTLTRGRAYQSYSHTITMASGNAGYSFELIGTLPDGLTLDETTGVISGTPTESGRFNRMQVRISHTDGTNQLMEFNMIIDPRRIKAKIVLNNTSIPYDGDPHYVDDVLFFDENDQPILDLGTPVVKYGKEKNDFAQDVGQHMITLYPPSGCTFIRPIEGPDHLTITPVGGASVSVNDVTVNYGESYEVEATATPANAGCEVQYKLFGAPDSEYTTTKPTAAGKYDIRAYTTNENYEIAYGYAVLTIIGDGVSFTVSENVKQYNGKSQKAKITNSLNLTEGVDYTVTYTNADGSPAELDPTTQYPYKVGNYKISITLNQSDEYTIDSISSTSFTIEKGSITFDAFFGTNASDKSAEYNKSGQTVTIKTTPEVDSSLYTVKYVKEGETEGTEIKDAAKYTVVFELTDNENYQITNTDPIELTVTKKQLKFKSTFGDGSNKVVYSGSTASPSCTCSNDSNIQESDYSYVFYKNGTTQELHDFTDAGEYNTKITLTDSKNYAIDQTSELALTIEKKKMSFTVSNNSHPYDGTSHTADITPTDSSIDNSLYSVQYQLGDALPADGAVEIGTHKIIIVSRNDNYTVDENFNEVFTITFAGLMPGNSPAAMIFADPAHEADTVENTQWKEKALESLRTNRVFIAEYTPTINGVDADVIQSIKYTDIGPYGINELDGDINTIIVKKITSDEIANSALNADPGYNLNGTIQKGKLVSVDGVNGLYKLEYTNDDTTIVRYVIEIPTKIGDTNGDGYVNGIDANALDKLDNTPGSVAEARIHDVNKDGRINKDDADAIRRRFGTKLVSYYPWVK